MTWNKSLIDGPITINTYGSEVTDADGNVSKPVTGAIKGYHLNAAPSLNPQTVIYDESGFVTASSGPLDAFVMVPTSPRQVWAGSETLFLKFKDEAEAKKVLADYWIEPTIGEA
jgi:hypothetical protein